MSYNSFMNLLNVYTDHNGHVLSQPIAPVHMTNFVKPSPHCPLNMPTSIVNHFQTMGGGQQTGGQLPHHAFSIL